MSPIVQAAANRAAQLRAELAQLEGVSTLAAQAEHVRNSSRVLQINNTTIAVGDGASFDTHILDPELVTKVRELIAGDREAKAEALMTPTPRLIGPDSPILFAPRVAEEDPAVGISVEKATIAGREQRERNGERKNPFKADHPLGIAWLAGYDAGTPPTAPATPTPPAAATKPAGPARVGGPVRPTSAPKPAAKSDPSPTDVW